MHITAKRFQNHTEVFDHRNEATTTRLEKQSPSMILELGLLLLAIQPPEEGEEEDYQTTVAEETEETTNYPCSDSKKKRSCVSPRLLLFS